MQRLLTRSGGAGGKWLMVEVLGRLLWRFWLNKNSLGMLIPVRKTRAGFTSPLPKAGLLVFFCRKVICIFTVGFDATVRWRLQRQIRPPTATGCSDVAASSVERAYRPRRKPSVSRWHSCFGKGELWLQPQKKYIDQKATLCSHIL